VIALLDYGSGNLRSIHKALLKVGANMRICLSPPQMKGDIGADRRPAATVGEKAQSRS